MTIVLAVLYRVISLMPSILVLRTIDNEWKNRRSRQRVCWHEFADTFTDAIDFAIASSNDRFDAKQFREFE